MNHTFQHPVGKRSGEKDEAKSQYLVMIDLHYGNAVFLGEETSTVDVILRDEGDNPGEMSLGSSTESYPAFAHIGLRENPGKNLNQDDNNAPSESAMRIYYKISHEIAKELKTFNESEFIKRCLIILADELCSQHVGEVEAIRLSRRTVLLNLSTPTKRYFENDEQDSKRIRELRDEIRKTSVTNTANESGS
ncbi:hypothetical protein ANN_10448 [Periplaneta americana]|uniref:Uncharacterized protein n=1 Tax=Periplaneta americana TaxID=6978 RepID=A0ABQ8TQX1_PERAM|nr:hypothetical protein ANN_10448 [Periplaneta americana]